MVPEHAWTRFFISKYNISHLCKTFLNLTVSQLADIVKHNGRLINHAVKKLVEDYESNKNLVMFQILAMLFEVILALSLVFCFVAAAFVDKPVNLVTAGLWCQAWDLSRLPSWVRCGRHCIVPCWASSKSILFDFFRTVNRESLSVDRFPTFI